MAGLTSHAGLHYGTTQYGGPSNSGTVFRLNLKTGAEDILYGFESGSDGSLPLAGVVYVKGTLYGTTGAGGGGPCGLGCGTVFMVDAATGAETVLHRFNNADGWLPQAMLAYWNGVFYGTTGGGGASGDGTVFTFNATTNPLNRLYSFEGGFRGRTPLVDCWRMAALFTEWLPTADMTARESCSESTPKAVPRLSSTVSPGTTATATVPVPGWFT